MSIEQTSVSNPVVRENEISSKRNAWSETQGSATGSKDGQLSSFWDKAFSGAQKLFGIETAAKNDLRKNEESLREEEVNRNQVENRYEKRRLDANPGFGNSGFSRISASIRREPPAELPEMAPTRSPGGRSAELLGARENGHDQRVEDSRREYDEHRDRIEDLDDDSESNKKEAKTADPLPITPLGFANFTSNKQEGVGQVVDNEIIKARENLVGINSARQESNMSNNLSTSSLEESPSKAQSPVEAIEEVSWGGVRRLLGDSQESVKPERQGLEAAKREGTQNAIVEAGKTSDSKTATLSKHPSSFRDSNSTSADSLIFDAEKAKQNLSSLLDSSKGANSNRSGQASSGGSPQTPQSVATASSPESPAVKEGGIDGEGKGADISKAPTSKNQASASVRQDAAKPILNASSSTGNISPEPSQSKRGEIPLIGSVARTSENTLSAGRPGIFNQSVSAPVGPVSTGVVTSNAESQVSNQLRSPSEKVLGKQEAESSPKVNVSAKSVGSTSKGDGVQGVQLNGSDNSGSSKSSFAAKAQAVSYTTKSAEETKEVYTALSKSVDRLVNTKSDTVSIRINFDQGGSMSLRVSMDSGQVSTSMQTDLPGLESLIKSSWSEFANDLNQKGVKLNAPQFTNWDSENSKNDHFMNFDQKGGRSKGESSSESRSSGDRRSNSSNRQQADITSSDNTEGSSDNLNTEQEFKTYA